MKPNDCSSTGHAYCWGWGDFGQPGDGQFATTKLSVAVQGVSKKG